MQSELEKILKDIIQKRLSDKAIHQFKIVVKYLCFVVSAAKVTVGHRVDKKTGEIVENLGTAQNIKTWILTPLQLSILENSKGLDYVILLGPNGSGKSMLLKEVGKQKQKANQDITVVYAIHNYREFKTLLYFMIKQELESHGIQVILINEDR